MANTVIPGMSFHHAALSVSDFDKSLKFYTQALGFTVYRSWTAGTGKKIALLDIGNGSYFEMFSDGEPCEHTENAGQFFHLALKVTDTKAAYDAAMAGGAVSHKVPTTMLLPSEPPIPVTLAFVLGPDGEQIEFFCPEE